METALQAKDDDDLMRRYYETKDVSLRNQIVERYLYLPNIITKKYLGKGVEYDDLFQVACVGLIKAANRFNPDVGVKFATYATPTILGEIKRYFRDKGCLVKLPRKIYEVFQKANRIRLSRMQYDGYIPTIDEIATVLDLDKPCVRDCMVFENVVNMLSLDCPVYNEDSPALNQIVGVEEDRFLIVENRAFLQSAVKKLTREEKKLVLYRYYRNLTQREIAAKWGVSQMYISRLERKVLEKLKRLYLN